MWEDVSLKKLLAIIKLSLKLTLYWHLPKGTTKFKIICVRLYHYLCAILSLCLTVGLGSAIRKHFDNPVIMIKSLMFLFPSIHIVYNILCYYANSYRLQFVTCKVENFCELINPHEEAVFQQYINKCRYLYGGALIWFYASTIAVIFGPVMLDDQPFPANVEYPFDIYRQPLRSFIYVHQSFMALLTCSNTCITFYMAFLLWYMSARFELLTEELRATTDIYGLMKCIRKHQKLLRFAEEVVAVVRVFAAGAVGCTMFSVITIGLIFFTEVPLLIRAQCVTLSFFGLFQVFMYTWPAEHLIHLSSEIGQAAYGSQWYKKSTELQKTMPIIILRAQKPILISIPCFIPTLSLNYYVSMISTIFSYFTTLRLLMMENN